MASEEQVERWVRRFHGLVCAELFGHGFWGDDRNLYDAMLRAFEHMPQDAWPVPSTVPAPQPPAPQPPPKAIQVLDDMLRRTDNGGTMPPSPSEPPPPGASVNPSSKAADVPIEGERDKPKQQHFSWEAFLAKYELPATASCQDFLDKDTTIFPHHGGTQREREEKWAFRFLALAWCFKREAGDERSNRDILKMPPYEAFRYDQLCQNKDSLEVGLRCFGVEICTKSCGWDHRNQYFRTLLRYSGWHYTQVLPIVVGCIRTHGWQAIAQSEVLRAVLANPLELYGGCDREDILDDVTSVFQQIARLHAQTGEVTVADVRAITPEIKPDIAQLIASELQAVADNHAKPEQNGTNADLPVSPGLEEPEEAKTAPEEVKPQPPEVEPEESSEEPLEALPEAEPPEVPPEKPKPFTWDRFFAWCEEWRADHPRDCQPKLTSESTFKDFLEFSQGFPRRGCAQEKWTFRLLALAWLFERDENDVRSNSEILGDANYEGFSYILFPQHPEDLRDGLENLGGTLRQAPNGNWQYVRTILYYSGWMYAQLASLVAERIRVRGWQFLADAEQVRAVVRERVSLYQEDSAGDEVLEEVVRFFQQLAQRYAENHRVSAEDVVAVYPAMKPPLARSIAQTLQEAQTPREARAPRPQLPRAQQVRQPQETCPEIELNDQGQPILFFPEVGRFNTAVSPTGFNVYGEANQLLATIGYYRQEDGTFRKAAGAREVPLQRDRPIVSVKRGRQQTEVLPEGLRNRPEFMLLRVSQGIRRGWRVEQVVLPGQKLIANQPYQVVPLSAQLPLEVRSQQERLNLDGSNRFTPLDGWEQVTIGDNAYPVTSSLDAYLRPDYKQKHIWRSGSSVYLGTSSPFNVAFCRENGIAVTYQLAGAATAQSLDLGAPIPEAWYWQPGTLRVCQDGQCLLSRSIVFVEEVPETFLEEVGGDANREARVTLTLAGEPHEITIPSRETCVRVEVRGCIVTLMVPNRQGVSFELSTGEAVIHVRPWDEYLQPKTKIARRDFENLKGTLLGWNRERGCLMTRGKTAVAVLNGKTFRGAPRDGACAAYFKAETDEHYAIAFCGPNGNISSGSLFPFEVYDPEKEIVDPEWHMVNGQLQEQGRSFQHGREGDDLVMTYWCAFLDRDRERGLAFYPAHRQDESPQFLWAAEKVEEQCYVEEETNRYQECLRIRGFYTKDFARTHKVDWGKGLLCFVVAKEVALGGAARPKVISSGFLVRAPETPQPAITNDPYGLREAFVSDGDCRENGKKLEEIITSSIPEEHAYVLDFLERMRNAVAELGVFEYLNSYWNRLVPDEQARPTGYAFLCGEHVLNTPDNFLPYRKLWSKALVSYYDFQRLKQAPYPNLNAADIPTLQGGEFTNLPNHLRIKLDKIVRNWKGNRPLPERRRAEITFAVEHSPLFNTPHQLRLRSNVNEPFDGHDWKRYEYEPRILFNPPEPQLDPGLIQEEFNRAWEALGTAVHQWRTNPTLEGAQVLRRTLVEIDEIDRELEKQQQLLPNNLPQKRVMNAILSYAASAWLKEAELPGNAY